jgi:NADH-quinone oxidoreductase subunit C
MNESLRSALENTFNDIRIVTLEDSRTAISVRAQAAYAVLRDLKDNGFDHLSLVSCVDWLDEGELEVVYVLTSYMKNNTEYDPQENLHLFLKTRIPRDEAQLKSAISIYPNAEPYEREMHELFGVHFEGHPRLIPLFLERSYDIPPFRKDFDTRQYVEDTFGPIPWVDD